MKMEIEVPYEFVAFFESLRPDEQKKTIRAALLSLEKTIKNMESE